MNRRSFLKAIGLGVAAAVAGRKVLAADKAVVGGIDATKPVTGEHHWGIYDNEAGCSRWDKDADAYLKRETAKACIPVLFVGGCLNGQVRMLRQGTYDYNCPVMPKMDSQYYVDTDLMPLSTNFVELKVERYKIRGAYAVLAEWSAEPGVRWMLDGEFTRARMVALDKHAEDYMKWMQYWSATWPKPDFTYHDMPMYWSHRRHGYVTYDAEV